MSKLGSNLVMDVAYCSTEPGTHVISYTRKNPPRPNQLWRKEPVGGNTFYLVSKLGSSCRITIQVVNLFCHYIIANQFSGLILQDGNALINKSGSCLRESHDGKFVTLIEDKTDCALTVRNASIVPDTPIFAFPTSDEDNQKWKYWTPEPFVRINCIKFSFLKSAFCVSPMETQL